MYIYSFPKEKEPFTKQPPRLTKDAVEMLKSGKSAVIKYDKLKQKDTALLVFHVRDFMTLDVHIVALLY